MELVGWATTGSGTTGGGNANPIEVTSYSDLESAMSGDEPRVALVSGTIDTGGDSLVIEHNKTLRGVDANATIVGGISINGSNVIVQNLTIQGKGQGGSPIAAIGNEYENTSGAHDVGYCDGEEPNDCESALPTPGPWTPPYPYKLDPATSVPELVMRCAGPQ